MNLFVLSEDVKENAQMHCDEHVVKMILEAAQMMCTCLQIDKMFGHCVPRNLTKTELADLRSFAAVTEEWYKPNHVNHPLSVWVRSDIRHYRYMREYALALFDEYKFRYGPDKKHKAATLCTVLPEPNHLPCGGEPLKWIACMPDEYKTDDVIQSYRNFYIRSKSNFASYKKNRPPPTWYLDGLNESGV